MARLHSFSDEAIAAIMTRHGQPQRYGRSRQNIEAVRVIHEQHAIDRHEQNELLANALIAATPELIDARRIACEIRQAQGWKASETDQAVNALKRFRRSRAAASHEDWCAVPLNAAAECSCSIDDIAY